MPKGKGLRVLGGKSERRGIRSITISTHNVRGVAWGRQYSTEKTRSDSIASYYTDGQ